MKILFVSYNHNRKNLADSIQNHRLVTALNNFCDVDIISRGYLKSKTFNNLVVSSPNLQLLDRVIAKLFPFMRPSFSVDKFFWVKNAVRTIRNRHTKYDAVIITFEPFAIKSIVKLLRPYTRNIVSIFYDPCYDNCFFYDSNLAKKMRKRTENEIVRYSDAVIANSEKLFKVFHNRYPDSFIKYIPFCTHNEEHFDNCKVISRKKVTIIHAGNIHGARHLDLLNDIIISLKERYNGNLSEVLQILMIGDCPNIEKNKIFNSNNGDVVYFKDFCHQEELLQQQISSDALLLINPIGMSNYSYPSKLCEYFQLNKIILCIGSLDSAANEDLYAAGHFVCDGKNINEFVDKILELLNNKLAVVGCINKNYYKKFLPSEVAKEYLSLLSSFK